MNIKSDFSSKLESEIINLVVKSPSILQKLKIILERDTETLSNGKHSTTVDPRAIEAQIGKLVVNYESDSNIVVKAPKKPPIPYDCRQLGFRDHRAKGWRFLINVLEVPPHTFNFGTAYLYPDGSRKNRIKNKAYDAGWKVCDDLCKKLIRFFHKEYGMEFPSGFKLYEKTPTGHPGDRRFKFQTGLSLSDPAGPDGGGGLWEKRERPFLARFDDFGEPQLKREIIKLNRDYSSDSKVQNVDPDNLVRAFKIGREKFGWNDNFIRELLLE